MTGQCDSGCADGWTGEHCSKGNKERERERDIDWNWERERDWEGGSK